MTKQFWQERSLLKKFDAFFGKIVDRMRIQSVENSLNNNVQFSQQKKFISILLDDKNEFSNDEVLDHVKAIVYGVLK